MKTCRRTADAVQILPLAPSFLKGGGTGSRTLVPPFKKGGLGGISGGAGLILAAVLLTACHDGGATAEEWTPASETGLPEDVRDLAPAAAEPEPPSADAAADGTVRVTGELVAVVESELVSRQGGRVGRVLVDDGDAVAAGQPLLELETEYLELELRAAEAERELARKQTLIDRESISRAVYERAQAAQEQATAARALAAARLELARQRLADAVLRSPFAGVVVERRLDPGENVQPSTVAFVVVQTRPLELRFRLPERYLPQARRGVPVRAFFDPYPGEVFTGEIHRVGEVVDPASRSLEVEARFDNRDGRLRPGMFARVELELTPWANGAGGA